MTIRISSAFPLFFLMTILLAGETAGAASVLPSADSDEILRLRATAQPELRFSYRKSVDSKDETIRVGLSGDYDYVETGGTRRLHDYRLRRIFSIEGGGQNFIDNSLYAEVWGRVMEMRNRAGIIKMLEAAHIDQAKIPMANDPFWIETELGVVNPAFARPEMIRTEGEDDMRWQRKDQTVFAARFRKETVPDALKSGLRRLWANILPLHPEIADRLAQKGRLPAEMTVLSVGPDQHITESHWVLADISLETAAPYPLPPHLSAAPTDRQGAFPEIFALLSADVAEKRLPPSEEVYAGRAQNAIGRGAGIEAILWLLEMQLASGRQANCQLAPSSPFCRLAPQAGALAKSDPRFAMAFGPQAPSLADRRKYDDLPNAYLLALLFANRQHPQDVGFGENEKGLLAGLKASPVANFCKDTGDFYLKNWNPFAAWQVLDLGRAMAGHHKDDLLGQVDTTESQLLQTAPTFF